MIIVPERLPIPVEGLVFDEHGRIRVAPALAHSDGYGIAALVNRPGHVDVLQSEERTGYHHNATGEKSRGLTFLLPRTKRTLY